MATFARTKPSPTTAPPPIWRRLFHLTAGSVVPVAGIFATWPLILAGSGALLALSLSLDLVRFRWSPLNRLFLTWLKPLLKSGEDYRITGATYMLISSFIAFLVFHQEVAVAALLFLAIGDPVAAFIGGRVTWPRLFGKSPVGTAAFIGASLLVVAVLVSSGAVQYHWGLLLGAVIAGLVELAPIPLDDNVTVPLVSGAVMHLLML